MLIEIGDSVFNNRIINIEDIVDIITKYSGMDKDQLKKLFEKN